MWCSPRGGLGLPAWPARADVDISGDYETSDARPHHFDHPQWRTASMTRKCAAFTIAVILLAPAFSLWAQVSTSSITGVVNDSSGAVVTSANVEVRNENTGVVYNGTTTGAGT